MHKQTECYKVITYNLKLHSYFFFLQDYKFETGWQGIMFEKQKQRCVVVKNDLL